MRTRAALFAALVGVISACTREDAGQAERAGSHTLVASTPHRSVGQARGHVRLGALPDRGFLIQYDRHVTPVRWHATTAYPVGLSEAHARQAIASGGMVVQAPSGAPVRVRYLRKVDHGDGNWTWIGRPEGAPAGVEAILTFGEKAVFGSIPMAGVELQLTTRGGRAWITQADASASGDHDNSVAMEADFVAAPAARGGGGPINLGHRPLAESASAVAISPVAAGAVGRATVDVVLGYTTGFATRLGGASQALTRLHYLVDIANQAYVDSQVNARIRLVHAVEVNYPDATSNQETLFALSGLNCTSSTSGALRTPDVGMDCTAAVVPKELQPLVAARAQYGADLVSLVRKFEYPENGSCGVAWLIGAGQAAITRADAKHGYSVVSDSSGNTFPDSTNTCREEYLVHELGHNMGLQHDRATAQGTDDTNGDGNLLDPEEFGVTSYAFGYSAPSAAGNFYTVMSLRRTGQVGYRVFSNPNITTCGGFPCGVADSADNARALSQTMPLVAAFAIGVPVNSNWLRGDFDGDGKADILWHNVRDGRSTIWRSANSATPMAVTTMNNLAWTIAGVGDFDGDGKSDVFWRNNVDGRNAIWRSADSNLPIATSAISNLAWSIAGIADFNGDHKADILWRNNADGRNSLWLSGSAATSLALTPIGNLDWQVAGVGDFDGDGSADVLWRNTVDGRNSIWRSANSATALAATAIGNLAWVASGCGDFNGDGKSDILWRNSVDGRNSIWLSGNAATPQVAAAIDNLDWKAAGVGDFDGDAKADILWRNDNDGRSSIWRAANSSLSQALTSINNLAWVVGG